MRSIATGLSGYMQRRSIRRAFSQYLSPEATAELARTPVALQPPQEIKGLYCLLLQVRDDTPDDIARNVERAVPICMENRGVIFDTAASMLLVVFGAFEFNGPVEQRSDDSSTTMQKLLRALGADVRIVAFSGDFRVGNIGSSQRFSFTVLLPKYGRYVAALLDTEFGHVTELGSIQGA